jgi:hypothetical protein
MTAAAKRRRRATVKPKPDPERNTARLLEILAQNLATCADPILRERLRRAIATLKDKRVA